MGSSLQSIILLVNSRDRDHSVHSSSDFTVETNTIHGAVGIDLVDSNLALGQSLINERNNRVLFYIGSETKLVEIATGDYSVQEIVDSLNTSLSATGLVVSVDGSSRLTFTHPSKSFKIVTTLENSMHRVLGLSSSRAILESQGNKITSPYPVNFVSGFEFVKISCPEFETDLQDDTPNNLQPGIGIYKVNDAQYTERLIRFPPRFFPVPKKISQIRVRLENPDGSLYRSDNNLDNVFVVRIWKLSPSGHRDN